MFQGINTTKEWHTNRQSLKKLQILLILLEKPYLFNIFFDNKVQVYSESSPAFEMFP